MTKRTARNRRHGTIELKGRPSPTAASENLEYTMIDLVRSVERLHFSKSGDRKETVLWADVKKYHKKNTGRVLSTEAFNKLAGVTGVSRKELIAGPLAGLLIAEDPAALVIRFKYDATKGDPLINHRYFLEASGAKTSVHNAGDVTPRLADVTNFVSPSRSETSSAASSLSPTCLSSISTDPDTEALSPRSAASPSSEPLSPRTCEYVTASEADASFLTARTGRTTPMTSDWSSSSSRADTESPDDRSVDQDKTFNLLNISAGDAAADRTMGPSELLVEMEASHKQEQEQAVKVVEEAEAEEKTAEKEAEEMKTMEREEEEGSDKENHSVEAAAGKPHEDVVVEDKKEKEEAEEPKKQADDVIDGQIEEAKEEQKEAEPLPAAAAAAVDQSTTEEVKEVQEQKEEEEAVEVKAEAQEEKSHDLAGGDGPLPVPAVVDETEAEQESALPPPPVPTSAVPPLLHNLLDVASSPVTASSSDETLLTVIERPLPEATVPQEEREEEQPLPLPVETMEKSEENKEREEEEEVAVVEKVEELAAAPAAVEPPKEEEQQEAVVVTEIAAAAVVEETPEKEEETVEKRQELQEEIKEVHEVAAAKTEEPRVETVAEKSEAAPVQPAAVLASEEELSLSSTTDEPTATTMVSAAAAAAAATATVPAPVAPPTPATAPTAATAAAAPAKHEPMTSDDVDMNDVLAGGPNRDAHTPSVTAPITLQPKPAAKDEDSEQVITHQPMVGDELDSAPPHAVAAAAAPSSSKDDMIAAASPDDLALRRAAPAKKFPCCTIV